MMSTGLKKCKKTGYRPENHPNIINHPAIFYLFSLFVMDQGSASLDRVLDLFPFRADNLLRLAQNRKNTPIKPRPRARFFTLFPARQQSMISMIRHGRCRTSPQLAAKLEAITGIPLRVLLGLGEPDVYKAPAKPLDGRPARNGKTRYSMKPNRQWPRGELAQ